MGWSIRGCTQAVRHALLKLCSSLWRQLGSRARRLAYMALRVALPLAICRDGRRLRRGRQCWGIALQMARLTGGAQPQIASDSSIAVPLLDGRGGWQLGLQAGSQEAWRRVDGRKAGRSDDQRRALSVAVLTSVRLCKAAMRCIKASGRRIGRDACALQLTQSQQFPAP
ncbi:hypothetical protein BS50DRAFT_40215 [Corynespora cassiicola Philippines]|uniref:Uncharacterized protein n=1 Tax=Corynespora cassiicola Philippines TaxID=1448308 RepID=A0A2T2PCP9_CORCC|nr:hypothetical protein BS50DRAFT_40215 [Corynespora cassiicola Philippines]